MSYPLGSIRDVSELPHMTGRPYQKSRLPAAFAWPCALAAWDGSRLPCTPRVWEGRRVVNAMNWDHCHLHNLIRGALCTYHNRVMAAFDRSARGYRDDSALIAYARQCPRCAARAAAITAAVERRRAREAIKTWPAEALRARRSAL